MNEKQGLRYRKVGEGVKTYDTLGGGGARESLEDAERKGSGQNRERREEESGKENRGRWQG